MRKILHIKINRIISWLFCFFIIVLLSGLLSSCNRNENQKKIYRGPFYLGQIKDYLYFKEGSTWIYQNSLSGELDTVRQIYCDTQFFEKSDILPDATYYNSYTLLDYDQKSSRNNCLIRINSGHINPIVYAYHTNYSKTCFNPTGGGDVENFFYPFDSTITGFSGSVTYYRGSLDSMLVLGKYYPDIQIFEVSRDGTIGVPQSSIPFVKMGKGVYYWSKGYGLIKIQLNTERYDDYTPFTHSWELLSSHLIR